MVVEQAHPEPLFRVFMKAEGFPEILDAHAQLCGALGIDIEAGQSDVFYRTLQTRVTTEEARALYALLDARAALAVYGGGNVCKQQKVSLK